MKWLALVIILFLAVALFGVCSSGDLTFREVKHIVLEWSLALFIALYFLKNKCLKLFLAWVLIRAAIGRFEMANSAFATVYINNVNFTLHTVFVCLIFYQVLADRLKSQVVRYVLNGVCILILLQALDMILQYFGVMMWIVPLKQEGLKYIFRNSFIQIIPMEQVKFVSGFLSHPNMAASLLALGIPAFFRPKWYWGIPVVCLALFFSHSLGGIIPAALALVVFVCWKAGKHRYWIIPTLISLCSVYIWKFDSLQNIMAGTGRVGVWKEIFTNVIPKHPIIGWGIGQYKIVFTTLHEALIGGAYIKERMVQAHNEFIQLWVDTGIIGVGIAISFLVSLVVRGFKEKTDMAKIALIGLMVTVLNSGVNFLFHTTPGIIGLLWFAILGKKGVNYE